MPRFTTQQTTTYLEVYESVALTTNHGVSGQLTVEVFDGVDYILTDTITDSGSRELFVKSLIIRFTPTNGMVYSVQLGR
ncbi:MAG TPA: hypothetical protein EYN54_04835 [Methylococcaceae bacterium]|nr:hypothetical protein [Methylococcaceae bacterium]